MLSELRAIVDDDVEDVIILWMILPATVEESRSSAVTICHCPQVRRWLSVMWLMQPYLQDLTRTCWCWDHFAYSISLYIIYVHVCIHKHTVNVQPQIPTLIQSTHGKFGQEARLPYPSETATAHSTSCFQWLEDLLHPLKWTSHPISLLFTSIDGCLFASIIGHCEIC